MTKYLAKLAKRLARLRDAALVLAALAAACTDAPVTAPGANDGGSPAAMEPSVAVLGPTATLVGAGNIARCDRNNDERTATLIDNIPGTVFTTGDNVYASGGPDDFDVCYGRSWGRFAARTRPAVGDKDYQRAGAAGYFGYFGAAAGDPARCAQEVLLERLANK